MEYLKRLIGVVCSIVAFGVVLYLADMASVAQKQNNYSMFSWEDEYILEEEREELIKTSKSLRIGTIYQAFSKDIIHTEETKKYLKDMKKNGMQVYYLTGEPEWGLQKNGKSLKKEILLVDQINQTVSKEERFKGIMVDVEPYLTKEWKMAGDAWKEEYFKDYVSGMVEAYQLAKEKKLIMIACIPHFFERYSEEQLEYLTANGCDGLAIMNYDRTDEIKQMEYEVKAAKKYKKEIIFISELQAPGYHSLLDINTYYNVGLEGLKASWKKAEEWFDYPKLSFSYHYYKPLKGMLN